MAFFTAFYFAFSGGWWWETRVKRALIKKIEAEPPASLLLWRQRINSQIILTKARSGPTPKGEDVFEQMPSEKPTWGLLLCQKLCLLTVELLEFVGENFQVHSKFFHNKDSQPGLLCLPGKRLLRNTHQDKGDTIIKGDSGFLHQGPACLHPALAHFSP